MKNRKPDNRPAYRFRKSPDDPIPDHVHGSVNAYDNYGCRCELCRDAKKAKMKRYRKRLILESLEDRQTGCTSAQT